MSNITKDKIGIIKDKIGALNDVIELLEKCTEKGNKVDFNLKISCWDDCSRIKRRVKVVVGFTVYPHLRVILKENISKLKSNLDEIIKSKQDLKQESNGLF